MRLKLVAVALAALAPVVAMLGYNEYVARQQRNEEIRSSAEQAARQASSEVERTVEGLHSLLTAVSAMPSVRGLNPGECSEALHSLVQNVPSVRTIFVVDLEGALVCGSPDAPRDVNFSDRNYFRAALSAQGFVVGTYTKSRISGSAVLPLAMPIMDEGTARAVVVTGIRLDWLQDKVAERGLARGNAVTLADSDGTILARVPFPERFVGTVIPDPFKSLIHSATPGVVDVTSQDGTDRVLGYRPISLPTNPLYVSAGFSRDEAFAPINRATLINILGIVLGALCALGAAILVGDRFISRPVHRIAGVLEQRRNGDTIARTAMSGNDELSEVGATLDKLLDELDCRTLRIKQAEEERELLVRELAHRVKNGFALVQAIARQTFARTDADQYRSFTERLAALAETYDLILSKDASSATITKIVDTAMRAHLPGNDDRIAIGGPDLLLSAEDALPLSLIIHELATNATKYGSLGSETGTVAVSWDIEQQRVHLSWVERGGPSVAKPSRKGFGSVLIGRAFPVRAQAESHIDFRHEGLSFSLSFVPEHVVPGEVVADDSGQEG